MRDPPSKPPKPPHICFRQKVMVVGGGDAAIDAAQYLSRFAARVYLVHRRGEFRSQNVGTIAALRRSGKVTVMTPYVIKAWTRSADGTFRGTSWFRPRLHAVHACVMRASSVNDAAQTPHR